MESGKDVHGEKNGVDGATTRTGLDIFHLFLANLKFSRLYFPYSITTLSLSVIFALCPSDHPWPHFLKYFFKWRFKTQPNICCELGGDPSFCPLYVLLDCGV